MTKDRQLAAAIFWILLGVIGLVGLIYLLTAPLLVADEGGDIQACLAASRLPECRVCCEALGNEKSVCSRVCAKSRADLVSPSSP